jgi:hypothetical protein
VGRSLPLLGYLLSRIEYGQASQELTEAPFFLTLPLHRLIALACLHRTVPLQLYTLLCLFLFYPLLYPIHLTWHIHAGPLAIDRIDLIW